LTRDHRHQPTADHDPQLSYQCRAGTIRQRPGRQNRQCHEARRGTALHTALSFAGRGQVYAPRTYHVIAGSYLAVNAYASSVSPAQLQAVKTRLEHTKTQLESADQAQISALTRESLLGDLFHAGGLGYYAQLNTLSYLMGLQIGGHQTLAAGTGTFGYEPNVNYFFGFPRSIKPGGVVFDIPLVKIIATNDGNTEQRKQFNL
jgi:hypothetical protein